MQPPLNSLPSVVSQLTKQVRKIKCDGVGIRSESTEERYIAYLAMLESLQRAHELTPLFKGQHLMTSRAIYERLKTCVTWYANGRTGVPPSLKYNETKVRDFILDALSSLVTILTQFVDKATKAAGTKG